MDPISRSTYGFCQGDCAAVTTSFIPMPFATAITSFPKIASRSRIKYGRFVPRKRFSNLLRLHRHCNGAQTAARGSDPDPKEKLGVKEMSRLSRHGRTPSLRWQAVNRRAATLFIRAPESFSFPPPVNSSPRPWRTPCAPSKSQTRSARTSTSRLQSMSDTSHVVAQSLVRKRGEYHY